MVQRSAHQETRDACKHLGRVPVRELISSAMSQFRRVGLAAALSICVGSIVLPSASSALPAKNQKSRPVHSRSSQSGKSSAELHKTAAKDNRTGTIRPVSLMTDPIPVSSVGDDLLVLGSGLNEGSYSVEALNNPERLVIDLNRPSAGIHPSLKNRSINLKGTHAVARVRFGAHPDKLRIVLDLRKGLSHSYSTRIENGRLTVNRNASEGESLTPPSIVSASIEEGEIEALAEQIEAPKSAKRAVLNSLALQENSRGNAVIAELSNIAKFTLVQSAPTEFVLTLQETSLANTDIAPIVAPPGQGSIRAARASAAEGSVVVRIFSAPEHKLSAHAAGRSVIVAPAVAPQPVAMNQSEMRAQLDPEKAEEGAAASKKPATPTPSARPATPKPPPQSIETALKEKLGLGDPGKYGGRLIKLDLQDTDIDNALRIIAEVSNLNIIASDDVSGKITLRLMDVPWDQALDVILKTNGLDKVQEGNVVRIAPVDKLRQEREALKQAMIAEQELEPLSVEYVRVSYARAAELRALVEGVLSERGSVAVDERTNQLIVKDIRSGIKNVAQLVSKLDLRTPQILLETQIVEAGRSILRSLGSEFGFNLIQSPATGNATGMNFPNSVVIGGSAALSGNVSSFPAAISPVGGSAISMLFGSADGTRSLSTVLTALESEGRVRVVSRPSVATTNNKAAQIKSVTRVRIKMPQGGLSVATGQGATAAGQGSSATESIEIGIVLDVTPQASPDYYVLLDIKAKSSNLGDQRVDDIPTELERSANSSVLVSSGQTFAMGGIYKLSDNDAVNGVPFFKDIPFFGHFFRRMTVNNADEELLFFITPRIIEGSFDDAAMKV